jgi:integral membrane sensor domain MASE1
MDQEIKVERVPWLPLIAIIALASITGSAALLFLDPLGATIQCTYNWGICSRTTTLAVLPFILLILAYPFRKSLNINTALLTYLYTIGTIMIYSN